MTVQPSEPVIAERILPDNIVEHTAAIELPTPTLAEIREAQIAVGAPDDATVVVAQHPPTLATGVDYVMRHTITFTWHETV